MTMSSFLMSASSRSILIRMMSSSSSTTSWSSVASTLPKSYKSQASKLAQIMEDKLRIEDNGVVSVTSGIRTSIAPEDLVSFMVTKRKTKMSPENISLILPEIEAACKELPALSKDSTKIIEAARKLKVKATKNNQPDIKEAKVSKAKTHKKEKSKLDKSPQPVIPEPEVLHIKDLLSSEAFKADLAKDINRKEKENLQKPEASESIVFKPVTKRSLAKAVSLQSTSAVKEESLLKEPQQQQEAKSSIKSKVTMKEKSMLKEVNSQPEESSKPTIASMSQSEKAPTPTSSQEKPTSLTQSSDVLSTARKASLETNPSQQESKIPNSEPERVSLNQQASNSSSPKAVTSQASKPATSESKIIGTKADIPKDNPSSSTFIPPASTDNHQASPASTVKPITSADKPQASTDKPLASKEKLQASSVKPQLHADKHQDKQQASHEENQGFKVAAGVGLALTLGYLATSMISKPSEPSARGATGKSDNTKQNHSQTAGTIQEIKEASTSPSDGTKEETVVTTELSIRSTNEQKETFDSLLSKNDDLIVKYSSPATVPTISQGSNNTETSEKPRPVMVAACTATDELFSPESGLSQPQIFSLCCAAVALYKLYKLDF